MTTLPLTLLKTSALNIETLSNGCYLLIEMVTLTWSFFSLLRLAVSFRWKFAVFNTTKDNHCIFNKINGGGVSSRFASTRPYFFPLQTQESKVKLNKIEKKFWSYHDCIFYCLLACMVTLKKCMQSNRTEMGHWWIFSCDCYLMPSKLLYTGKLHGFFSSKSWEFLLTSR